MPLWIIVNYSPILSITAAFNQAYTLLMYTLQTNELCNNSSKHVPTVHTKRCIRRVLRFHKAFPAICC